MTISRKTLLKLSVSIAFMPGSAWAQTTQPGAASEAHAASPQSAPADTTADAARSAPAQPGQIAEIVITAQQRGENLQRAAIPVSVVSGADLIRDGITGLDSLQKSVPALQVAAGANGNLVFIRGVGNFSFLASSDPAAAFNYDGIYVGRSSSTLGAFYDLERVEVLKGPQGTLYGRNATAGAINVLPVQPRYGELSGYATASYGNFDARTLEGALNLPIGNNAAFRISGTYLSHDGYLRDGTQANDTVGLRAQVKVDLTPELTVRISADYAHVGGEVGGSTYLGSFAFNPAAGQFVATPSGLSPGEGLFTPAAQAFRTTFGAAGRIAGRFLDPLPLLPNTDSDFYGAHAQINWRTPIGTLTIIPAWQHALKNTLGTEPAGSVGNVSDANQYSIEARLVSNPGRTLDYILGAYYFSEHIDDDTHVTSGALANFILAHYDTHSPSAYGRLTLHATDWLRFTGGLRYTEDHKTFTSLARSLAVICVVPAACPTAPLLPYTTSLEQQPFFPAASGGTVVRAPGVLIARSDRPATGDNTTNRVTYRGAVEVDIGPRSLGYASIETGYRAGGFNNDAPYLPESITAYTLGLKNRFFGNRAQLNIEAFDWEYRDQQLTFLGIDGAGILTVLTRNIGRSRVRGIEVEAMARPLPNTTLSGSVQYVDSNYLSFTYVTPARPFVGCNVTPAGALFTVDCSGHRLFNSPRWTVNLAAQQIIPMGELQIVLDADTQYRSSRDTGFEFIAAEHVGSTWRSNAQISFGRSDGRWSIAAYVRNIENDRSTIYATPVPGSTLIVGIPSTPRTYGIRLSGRF